MDLINRQDVIDASRNKIVSTNPDEFYAHDKFIKFMDNPETKSYGRWEWSNGYNTALVSMQIELDKIPSAEPEVIRCKDCKWFGDIGCAIRIVDDSDKPTENDFCSFAERRTRQNSIRRAEGEVDISSKIRANRM